MKMDRCLTLAISMNFVSFLDETRASAKAYETLLNANTNGLFLREPYLVTRTPISVLRPAIAASPLANVSVVTVVPPSIKAMDFQERCTSILIRTK